MATDFSHYEQSELTGRILASAEEVHRVLGPGLLETAYRRCLVHQLQLDAMSCRQEVMIPLHYRGLEIETAYRADLIVEDAVLVELKAMERLLPVHSTQMLTYLRLTKLRIGLLINFNVYRLKFGVKRLIC